MRKLFLSLAAILVLSLVCAAQDNTEIFGGYSYLRVDSALTGTSALNTNGWDASVTRKFLPFLGATADFNGQYGTDNTSSTSYHFQNFLFGPTVYIPHVKKVQPFVHALFGVSHLSTSNVGLSSTDNAFAMALGGGVDVKLTKMLAFRVAQVDYMRTQFFTDSQDHLRIASGLVLRF